MTYRPGWSRLGDAFGKEFANRFGLSIRACHIGTDAADRLGQFARRAASGTWLIVSDENTYRAGGEGVARALRDTGLSYEDHRFGAESFDATDALGNEVARDAETSSGIVAIGSGTICDLAKYAGTKLNRPVLLYPTAASMNGYTSGIVALKVRGLKRTIPCAPALGVFANPEDVAKAPQRMAAAGVGDFLSKCSSATDWRASHLLLGVPFDPTAREFFEGIQERLLDAAPAVGRAEPEAVGLVLEALLLSGFSMVVAGSSAPASGGEHLISHYLDMKSALRGTPHDLHGTQVGVATVYCLGLWERILAIGPEAIDADALVAHQPDDDTVRGWILDDWGPEVGAEVQAEWDAKKLDAEGLRRLVARFSEKRDQVHRELPTDLLPSATVAEAIRASGGPTEPEALNAPLEEYENAKLRARYIRNRFTVLDLAQDLGVS